MEDSDSCSGPKQHWHVQFALLTFAYSKILWFDGLLVPLFVCVSFCGDVSAVLLGLVLHLCQRNAGQRRGR